MPIPTTIADLNVSAALNSPAGSDSPTQGDDYIRALSSIIAQEHADLADATNAAKGAGQIGANLALSYGDNTMGWAIKQLGGLSAGWFLPTAASDRDAVQTAVTLAEAINERVIIPAGEWTFTTPVAVSGSRLSIAGSGMGQTQILCVGCDAFTVAAGAAFVTIEKMDIAISVRYTTTPNTKAAIKVEGTSASQCYWHTYRDLLIDGFETGIVGGGLCSSTIDNVRTVYTLGSVYLHGQPLNNTITNCKLSFDAAATTSGSYGVKFGDGTTGGEGLAITGGTLIYGVQRGVWSNGAINCTVDNTTIIDFVREYGFLSEGTASGASINHQICPQYIAFTGTAGSAGVYLANDYAPADSQNRGSIIRDIEILAYSGSSMAYGILCDGSEEERNLISGCRVQGATVWDCRITTGSGHILSENRWRDATGFSATVPVKYDGTNIGNVSGPGTTYSASITPDASVFKAFVLDANNGTAFTINAPINAQENEVDVELTFVIRNVSGGALGAVTWNAAYKLATWTQPGNGFSRAIVFRWNGTNWVEKSRTPADVPN